MPRCFVKIISLRTINASKVPYLRHFFIKLLFTCCVRWKAQDYCIQLVATLYLFFSNTFRLYKPKLSHSFIFRYYYHSRLIFSKSIVFPTLFHTINVRTTYTMQSAAVISGDFFINSIYFFKHLYSPALYCFQQ